MDRRVDSIFLNFIRFSYFPIIDCARLLVDVCSWSRLCENACAILKSALLSKICQRLVNQQTGNSCRSAIFVPFLTLKSAPERFHTAWTVSCLPEPAAIDGKLRPLQFPFKPLSRVRRRCFQRISLLHHFFLPCVHVRDFEDVEHEIFCQIFTSLGVRVS